MQLAEILSRNRELGARMSGDRYHIAVMSNIVVTPFKEIIELTLREEGVNAEVELGDYNQIVQESARLADADAVIIFWESCNFVEGLEDASWLMTDAEVTALEARVYDEMALVLRNLRATPLVLINAFSAMLFAPTPLRDSPLRRLCSRLNETLKGSVGGNQTVVDLDAVIAEVGVPAAADHRLFQRARALYSIEFAKAYAAAVRPAFLSATGRARKVLVLDCDNTLWGGVLGEDGESAIEMNAETVRGRPFHEVQTIARGLQRSGVLLALCSRNDLNDVLSVLRGHPDMVLKEEDFVAKKVNWIDKVTNLESLALELNVGFDSFVFVDDSAFEIGLIKARLGSVRCFQVPGNLSDYPPLMRKVCNEFFALSTTREDAQKTAMYQAEGRRRVQQQRFASTDEYLASLGLQATISWGDGVEIPRAAQLTQKTNQFNLTTRRYTEADIRRILYDRSWLVVSLAVRDRYGDYGVTGLAICRRQSAVPEVATIDTFLMSCRVIGRNVEYSFFDQIARRLSEEGCSRVEAEYIATSKNGHVNGFFDDLGMSPSLVEDGHKYYSMALGGYRPRNISYIQVLSTTEGT